MVTGVLGVEDVAPPVPEVVGGVNPVVVVVVVVGVFSDEVRARQAGALGGLLRGAAN